MTTEISAWDLFMLFLEKLKTFHLQKSHHLLTNKTIDVVSIGLCKCFFSFSIVDRIKRKQAEEERDSAYTRKELFSLFNTLTKSIEWEKGEG